MIKHLLTSNKVLGQVLSKPADSSRSYVIMTLAKLEHKR